jgi:hypothetical protein
VKKVKKTKTAQSKKKQRGVDLERLDIEKYKKLCQGNTSINNSMVTLRLQDCDGRKLRFKLEFNNTKVREKVFDFDFRFYNPYKGNGGAMSGLYVFKTEEFESNPFDHAISNIQVF